MFLRIAFLAVSLFCWGASAQEIPGLQQKKAYKLKSFTKNFRGKKTETRAGRENFCAKQIVPRLIERDGKPVLELGAALGFEWRNIDENPQPSSDGCRYPVLQRVESGRDGSTLVLINGEECPGAKTVTGSLRETLLLNGNEISYQSETVAKDGQGQWRNVEAKEGFTCLWSVD